MQKYACMNIFFFVIYFQYGIEVLPEHIQQPPAHIVEESSK